jgi:hypothetical protein
MTNERKADLEARYAELEHEVWLAIKQGAHEGVFRAVVKEGEQNYALIVRYGPLGDPVTINWAEPTDG